MKKLILLVFLAGASSAWGQYGELWFNVGKSMMNSGGLGSPDPNGPKDDVKLDDGLRFGFRFTTNTDTRYGYEFQYAYSRTHLLFGAQDLGGMAIHTGGVNYLIYATQEGTRVRPFATGGVNFSNYVPPGSSAAQGGGSTKFGVNYGGGIKVRIMDRWAVRFDLRQYTTPKPNFFGNPGLFNRGGWIRQTEIGGGFGFVF